MIALWKPHGHVSRFTDESGHPGLATLVPVAGVYPIGRLDHDSEGLLLLTDDPSLAHALTDPRFAHPRVYWAQVEGIPDERALAALQRGVVIQGRRTRAAEARRLDVEPELPPRVPPIRLRRHIPTAWIELTLREGRNRQVRRMTAAVGHPTLRLVRVAIPPLDLLALGIGPGAWRRLRVAEVLELRAALRRPESIPAQSTSKQPRAHRARRRGDRRAEEPDPRRR